MVTSSDAHILSDIGKSRTVFRAPAANAAEIGKALRREEGRRAWIPEKTGTVPLTNTMEDLSLHILDIVENALSASADRIEIRIVEDTGRDLLSLEIADNGKGMDAEMRKKALDPFFTTRTTRRIGLGLPLLAQAAEQSGGWLELESEPGRGTRVIAVFQRSHPDRKPLGDTYQTLRTIVAGRPELDLRFEHTKDSQLVAEFSS
jgi:signal transduction histidine kinase